MARSEGDGRMSFLRERIGPEAFERLTHLDRVRGERTPDLHLRQPDSAVTPDFDVALAGGGLSLLLAAELARLGLRVMVIERARAGAAHREWNASASELVPLVESGIFTDEELERAIVGRYDHGICAFHGAPPRIVRGVLDRAIDARAVLEGARRACERLGVTIVDGAAVNAVGCGESAVRVGFGWREVVARVLVDARGASSPYATADLVCPTVGGVIRGLDDIDPRVGEILVTTENADVYGRQHVWEGFPGREGEAAVYLFYYARREAVSRHGLVRLYDRFFTTLGQYKSGDAELVRPTFGYIPGWSRLTPAPRAPSPRMVLFGDAAARHSPLTFCGFGSMLRSFRPAARAIAIAIADETAPGDVFTEEPIHAWTGALARVMASGALTGAAMNALLDDAFATLEEMGNEPFAALLQDRMDASTFTTFLRRTAWKHPAVYREVLGSLGARASARWAATLLAGAFA
jgi:lycopene cyclase CruA